jgi:hypothetical protein
VQGASRMLIDTGQKPIRIDSKISVKSRLDKL